MQHSASLSPPDNWTEAGRNKPNVSMSSSALKSVADARPPASPSIHDLGHDGAVVDRLDEQHFFIAASPAMFEVRRQIEQLAAIDAPVLIVGECGTGKELVARMIHKLSGRATHDFFKVSCSALPAESLESELYGQEAGVFSAASESRPAKSELAHKSTILLDDVAGLPFSAQPRLLKVLQEGEFVQKGGSNASECDVRVIAATDMDLRQAVQNGGFRADLYYRLNGFTIYLPPLRKRRDDIPHLLNYFMDQWSSEYERPRLPISREILEMSNLYSWPGNIRELENFVKRYLVLGDESVALDQIGPKTDLESIPEGDSNPRVEIEGTDVCDLKTVVRDLKQDAEKAAIIQALERTHGNKQEAASLLHISLRALHYKVRAYSIESASLRAPNCVGFPGAAPSYSGQEPTPGSDRAKNLAAGKVLTMARSVSR